MMNLLCMTVIVAALVKTTSGFILSVQPTKASQRFRSDLNMQSLMNYQWPLQIASVRDVTSPARILQRFLQDDDFFSFTPREQLQNAMKVDVKETEQEYILEVDVIPGLSKADIKLELQSNVLEISFERSVNEEEKQEKYVRKERFYGKVSRSLVLPADCDEDHLKAQLENGVLRISVPRIKGKQAVKTIEILTAREQLQNTMRVDVKAMEQEHILEVDKVLCARRGPIPVEVEEGKAYYYCTCGRSKTQPFCNGSHKGTAFKSSKWTATETRTVYFCTCKQSSGGALCDGSHRRLPEDAEGKLYPRPACILKLVEPSPESTSTSAL